MNVYDFDGTIYDGDSTKDFLLYMFCRRPLMMASCLPRQFGLLIAYRCKRVSLTEMKAGFFGFLRHIDDVDPLVRAFWDRKAGKLKAWYLSQKKSSDVIISASPEFLLHEICRRIGIVCLIATKMDRHTGAIHGDNCKGPEKVNRFRQVFGAQTIEEFYSDSQSDIYMAQMAKTSYFVIGDRITHWETVTETERDRMGE